MAYKLSPSKAHRYLNCTKSLEFDVEFKETQQTIRGSILHKYAEMIIKNEEIKDFVWENDFDDYENFLIQSYVKSVYEEKEKINADILEVEKKRTINIYDFSINLIIDVFLKSEDAISIIDLKTGNGDVEVGDNEQLLFYAASVLLEFPKVKTFRLSIFQKGKMKTTIVSRDTILNFFVDKFDVFEKIKNNKLEFNPSEKACKFCAIKKTCVERAKWIVGGKNG